ncbi:hypothetical protein [Flagellimonas onchidii]|uniref:hypothetical protein n=1 Tax=Flagellimonas onchidii TaxID=2562684 RepID=UPI0010A684E8|nr:hypothetical protein [Allomuricauda onchidii]
MTLKKLFSFLPVFLFLSCINSEDDCSVLCPQLGVLAFDVRLDGDNVFENGIYSLNDLTINDANTVVSLESISSPILLIQDPDWGSSEHFYTISLGDNDSFTVNPSFELSERSECCAPTPLLSSIVVNSEEVALSDAIGKVIIVNL